MLYVLIMYCSGFCGPLTSPPSDVLFFTSYADCQRSLSKMPVLAEITRDGRHAEFKETCARVFADPGQLDRLLDVNKLKKMLADYKAHGDGWRPWRPSAAVLKQYRCAESGGVITCKDKRAY